MKYFVVCDILGDCRGVFTNKEVATKIADHFGGIVSEEEIQTITLQEADVIIKNDLIKQQEEYEYNAAEWMRDHQEEVQKHQGKHIAVNSILGIIVSEDELGDVFVKLNEMGRDKPEVLITTVPNNYGVF